MKKSLILAVAVAGFFTLAVSVNAAGPLLSPKAKEQADSLKRVPGTTVEMLDRSVKAGSPRAIELANSLHKVPGSGPSIDLAHAPRPILSPRDPRYETALRENSEKNFQVAPLK